MGKATIAVCGPTASGKSALALALAETVDGIVINADAMQVYRQLRILTARPGPADEARVPHRLYGVLSAAESCSVARWRDLALAEIAAAHGAGRVPILVGGTGLYIRALSDGLAAVPEIPREVRDEAAARHRALGGEAFQAELGRRDPVMAGRLAPGDRQRLIRAWEVHRWTGRSLADWQAEAPPGPGLPGPLVTVVMIPPRAVLYDRIDARFRAMVGAGAVAEVGRLLALDLAPSLPAMKALGVKQLGAHLAGDYDLEGAILAAQTATRRYAKRQMTWFRNQIREAFWTDAKDLETLRLEIFPKIVDFLLTTE